MRRASRGAGYTLVRLRQKRFLRNCFDRRLFGIVEIGQKALFAGITRRITTRPGNAVRGGIQPISDIAVAKLRL